MGGFGSEIPNEDTEALYTRSCQLFTAPESAISNFLFSMFSLKFLSKGVKLVVNNKKGRVWPVVGKEGLVMSLGAGQLPP